MATSPDLKTVCSLCRDCGTTFTAPAAPRCGVCGGPRLVFHPELPELAIAHLDCDAFYASIEKRDRPELAERPVIVGGGRRGVVAACCYVARLYGVRSAMPMFKALKACPDAVVIRPDMAKYQEVGLAVRELMLTVTPLVEPLSIDEAFLDLSGTEALHGGPAAQTLAGLAKRIEARFGITVSIGLSYNKSLAKIASDLDKPSGFAVIGRRDAGDFLRDRPVSLIWGVGKTLRAALERDGITRIGQLLNHAEADLVARYGAIGSRLYRFSRGLDDRPVDPRAPVKSISAETTFDADIADYHALAGRLWPLCEKVSARLKRRRFAGRGVTLKLKTDGFRILTRSRRLVAPTQLAEVLYEAGTALLERESDGRRFRLIGIGTGDFTDAELADPPDLLTSVRERQARVEAAIDLVRDKLGPEAIRRGRGLVPPGRPD